MNVARHVLIPLLAVSACFQSPSAKPLKAILNTVAMEHVVKRSIEIKAEPARVWDALTNPELTKKYFFHSKVYSDWKTGSPITFKSRIFLVKKIEMSGTILAIEQNRLLKYNLKNTSDESGTVSNRHR